MPDGTKTEKGKICYQQMHGAKAYPGDSLERLIDTKSGHVQMKTDDAGKQRPGNSPHMSLEAMADAYEQIAGELPRGFAIRNARLGGGTGIITVSTAGELHKVLTELKTGKTLDGKPIEKPADFPIILQVHSNRRPFSGNEDKGGTGGRDGAYHVVMIWDYDNKTGDVFFKNQWGRASDHLGRKGGNGPVHVATMADSTIKPPPPPPPPATPARK